MLDPIRNGWTNRWRSRAGGAILEIVNWWQRDLEHTFDLVQSDADLRSSHGFLVDSEDAREVGVVDDVAFDAASGRVASIDVCGGWFGRRRWTVPVDEVIAIHLHERRIVVTNASVGRDRG